MDGSTVFFARQGPSASIWKVPVEGGEESQVGDFRVNGRRSLNFAVGAQGIYYASSSDPIHWFELWLYRFSTGKSERIRRIDKMFWQGLSVSPDDRWLLFVAAEDGHGDLQMVENFRCRYPLRSRSARPFGKCAGKYGGSTLTSAARQPAT